MYIFMFLFVCFMFSVWGLVERLRLFERNMVPFGL